jgi:cytoskeletal protein RodZ
MPEIGATLREARMRARIDVSEIEAQTKIRAKYLRALENEEWSLLPGPTFVKSFLRTYAQALGLDARPLVEEYRLHHEGAGETYEPIVSSPRRSPRRPPRQGASRGYVAAVSAIGAVIVLLIVLLATSGGSGGSKTPTVTVTRTPKSSSHHTTSTPGHATPVVALSLKPTAVVYVCLVGDGGHLLVPGVDLQPGEATPTFHAHHFLLTLGNSSVVMYVDGRPREVPPSSQAIGYSITKTHGRRPLSAEQMPTCG